MTTAQPQHVLTLQRVIDAPAAALWRCWTEPELLNRWFCPKPWFVADIRVELRPGGESFNVMNGPESERFDELAKTL